MKKLLLLVVFSTALLPSFGQQKVLTLEDIYHPDKRLSVEGSTLIGFQWLRDAEHYVERGDQRAPLVKVNALSGQKSPLFQVEEMEAAFRELPGITPNTARRATQGNFTLSPDESALFLYLDSDLYYYNFARREARRLTNTSGLEKEAEFSPDGKKIAFVRENDLYVADLETGRERRLTRDGSDRLLNGILDWVYQEELYGRGNYKAFWWSPDSTRLAFLQLDESDVPTFPVVGLTEVDPILEEDFYPQAGDPNPKVRLGVVNTENARVEWVDQGKYGPEEILIVRVTWTPDGQRVVYQVQNREQTWLDLNSYDPVRKRSQTLLRETSKAWVEVLGVPVWLKDGSFLWQSERSGRNHIYRHGPDGKLISAVTSGSWTVCDLYGIDTANEWVYFAAQRDSVKDEHVYRIRLDGSELARLTKTPGSHSAEFNRTFSLFADTWSDIENPPRAELYRTEDGQLIRALAEKRENPLKDYRLSAVEFVQVKSYDGFPLEASIIKPPDFDPTRRYPVLIYTYGGPQAPVVRNAWQGRTHLWHQFLAQQGYIICEVDPRAASGKAAELAWPIHRRLGELELRDIEASVEWLKQQPYVDGSRIGIWGWSYGGFMAAYALTHSRSFKAGIAGAPVTDWRLYDSIYTERYMGLPTSNRAGYEKSSIVRAARDLHGKLLLVHGLIDDNVHVQNSVMLMYELQQAGKDFEVMFYPNSRHGVSMPSLSKKRR